MRQEKERSQSKEEEAFTARYQLVGVQERLDEALERVKVVEQERDAYKTAAKNEEVARIAAEGRIPLPKSDVGDEFSSPYKKRKSNNSSRISLSTMDITTSIATEMEISELNEQVAWEKQRAERALEMIEFLQAECQMNCCPCSKKKHRASLMAEARRRSSLRNLEPAQLSPEPEQLQPEEEHQSTTIEVIQEEDEETEVEMEAETDTPSIDIIGEEPPHQMQHESESEQEVGPENDISYPRSKKEARLSTVFVPQEGVFRTVSEQEAEEMAARNEAIVNREDAESIEAESRLREVKEASVEDDDETIDAEMEMETEPEEAERNARMYARTPSVDPPTFAVLGQERVSLLSLLNAPLNQAHEKAAVRMIKDSTMPDEEPRAPPRNLPTPPSNEDAEPAERPFDASTSSFTVTTKVAIKDDTNRSSSMFSEKLRTPTNDSNCSFDTKNPALTPTMTREEALAKIRERRGRAKSAAQAASAMNKKTTGVVSRRDMSAPMSKTGGRVRS